MKFLTFFIFPFFVFGAPWNCQGDIDLNSNDTVNYFPQLGADPSYGKSASCRVLVNIPTGKFAHLSVFVSPDVGDTITGSNNNYLNMNFKNNTPNMVVVGPSPFIFTIQSSPISSGTFHLQWSLYDVNFPNQKTTIVSKGQQPNVFGSYQIFQGAQTLSSADGGELAISTASYGKLDSDSKMTGAFVYQGATPSNLDYPIFCLYNRIDENVPLLVESPVTVVYFAQPETYDAWAISVSSRSDVQNFSQLRFVYYDNLGPDGRFVVDATDGTAAMMVYQNNNTFDTFQSYILSNSSSIFSVFAGGVPVSSSQLLSTYGVYATADNALPQWIPGKLTTFYMNQTGYKQSVSISTNPKVQGTLPARANLMGFFKSTNYPFSDSVQDCSLYFQSNDPLILTLSLAAIDAATTLVVNTTGITGPQSCSFPSIGNNCTLYGTNFRFTSQSMTSPSTGGLLNYYFTGNVTTTPCLTCSGVSYFGLFIFAINLIFSCSNFITIS